MEEDISKSEKKREAIALKKFGQEISELSREQINSLPLSEILKKAILENKAIKSHSAKKRSFQYIARLLRETDNVQDIKDVYEKILEGPFKEKARFHTAERWRERLLSEGNTALTEFMNEYSYDDVQQLRQLIKQVIKERDKQQNLGSPKTLFRTIMSILP